jgi:hypothetical protein
MSWFGRIVSHRGCDSPISWFDRIVSHRGCDSQNSWWFRRARPTFLWANFLVT